MPTCTSIKCPLNTPSRQTPAPKRFQHGPETEPETDLESEMTDSPTRSTAKRRKSSNAHTSQKRTSARPTFTPPPQPIFCMDSPQLTPNPPQTPQLLTAFETPKAAMKTLPPMTPPMHETPAQGEDSDKADFLEELESLCRKEDINQSAGIFNIGGVFQKDIC